MNESAVIDAASLSNRRCGWCVANRWVKRWVARIKRNRTMTKNVRALVCKGAIVVVKRSKRVGFGGGARNAMEKSAEHDGDDGVTIIAGRGDFSSGGQKSDGAGTRM